MIPPISSFNARAGISDTYSGNSNVWKGVSEMCDFGDVAVLAATLLRGNLTAEEAWEVAAARLELKKSMQEKSCPKHAFIGLCEYGYIEGIVPLKQGEPDSKNAKYAVNAADFLRQQDPQEITNTDLWREAVIDVDEPAETRNGQMDVVLALWNHDPRWIEDPSRKTVLK